MKKGLVIGLLVIVAILIGVFTFIVGAIKLVIGCVLLGVALVAVLIVWGLWKIKED